ncbi:MAG TPA: 4-hydroxy-3-methylbut-2-enyl diphosphate reductase [Solirubrobacteraceae bacterium]|nr:4-hydroxy-3-methylbut-2-enyl diphosphate reductase [Solirubrobacteraceae bacterium]
MIAPELTRLAAADEPPAPCVLVLAPMSIEARAVRAGAPWAQVQRIGMGPHRAKRAASLTRDRPTGAVIIAGFCGALDPELEPGDIVLASELRGPTGTTPCPDPSILAGHLRRGGFNVRVGPVASTQRLVVRERRRALQRTGALAVDMESAWLAPDAHAEPLVTLRVVLDTHRHELHRPLRTAAGAARAYKALRGVAALVEDWAKALSARELVLASPRASCAGVVRAVEIVERALEERGAPIYVRKQIVHNAHVVGELERKGAVFVDEVDEVPQKATVIFSAHGVSPAVRVQAERRELDVIDATCPLVAKVHAEARRFANAGHEIVLIGHHGHEEVEGTVGEAPEHTTIVETEADVAKLSPADPDRIAYLTQTTLAVDETVGVIEALRERFPRLAGPSTDDICYATQNRQDAVRELTGHCDVVLVVGAENSSNSKRLVEVSERAGTPAHLIADASAIRPEWIAGRTRIGLTAGASAPESLVGQVVDALDGIGTVTVSERTVAQEDVYFKLPARLRKEQD